MMGRANPPKITVRHAGILVCLAWMVLGVAIGCGTFEVGIEEPDSSEVVVARGTPADAPPIGTPQSDSLDPAGSAATPEAIVPPTLDPLRSEFEIAPNVNPLEIAITWAGEVKGECQSLQINRGGEAAIGPCKQSAREMVPLDDRFDHGEWWLYWLERFSPFNASTPSGQIVFQGYGLELASPAWQRAMAVWAELLWVELKTDGSSESWSTALSLQQEMSGRPGFCQTIHVSTYGLAQATYAPCQGGDPRVETTGWLTTEEWEQLDAGYYSKVAFADDGLSFFAAGPLEMTLDEAGEVRRLAEAIFNRLMVGNLIESSGQ